jgi:hypothetical protein
MRIASVNASGITAIGPEYGPTSGWSAIAIADGPADDTWVLWRSADGRAAVSLHRHGAMTAAFLLAAYQDWSADDLTVGADGRPRVLRTSPSGLASVVTIDERGLPTSGGRFTLPGFTPRRISAGADGLVRLLFGSEDGQGQILLLDANNRLASKTALHPLASIVVTTAAELEAALVPANAGKQILVKAGDYVVANPLTVPDRATLVGEGEMLYDGSGLPTGMAASGRTVLRAAADLAGDILTLGNGSSLRGLFIEDVAGRAGNPVVVVSRVADDLVSAAIEECEIMNPNPSAAAPPGPTGRSVVVMTRNPNLSNDPPPHDGSMLNARISRSVMHSPGTGYGVFAINFASQAKIDIDLTSNAIGGGLGAAGGVSRPEAVTGSGIVIRSKRNLYRSDSADPTPTGWTLSAGSTAAIPNIVSEASTSNSLKVHSTDDRIEGFAGGIFAAGGQRVTPTSEPVSSNSLELNIQGMHLQSVDADLTLFGGFSFIPGVAPGDRNKLRLSLRQATGSGTRANSYANSPDGGDGNRLIVDGSANSFAQTNQGIDPAPPAEFFTSQH